MIDRAELTRALDVIWQRVRRLNRYVEERAPWQLAKDDARADELDRVLRTLVGGLRVLARAAAPLPARQHREAARRARLRGSLAGWRALGLDAGARASRIGTARVAVPEVRVRRLPPGPTVIDSHTHLHLCEPPNAELVAAADAAGVTRMLTVGIDGASCRAALAAAEDFPQVYAAIGRHPNAAKGFDDADLAELRALAAHERCAAIGETRPRLLPRQRAAAPTSSARSRRRSRSRARPASRW